MLWLSQVLALDLEVNRLCGGRRWTLDPQRERATPLADLIGMARGLLQRRWPALEHSVVMGLCRFVEAQIAAFPENLFWDFEYLLLALVEIVDNDEGSSTCAKVNDYFATLCTLHQRYGQHSAIRFRYVHDFTYGFDWSKWVRRDPSTRQGIGPFAPAFIDYLRQRASEIESLIAQNHATYGALPPNAFRNPFGFSREPDDEAHLLREMARRELVPVRAWLVEKPTTPILDYSAARKQCADELGLLT